MTRRRPTARRAAWLAAVLCVGCAMLPTLEPAQVHYFVRTDWDGVPLEDGERVIETDLGYAVGLTSFQLRTTSLELIPCAPLAAALDPRPACAFAHGGAYVHDLSAVEPGTFDDLMIEQEQLLGTSIAGRSFYCELFGVHGTGRDEVVASLAGWYRAPDSSDAVPFAAEHPLGVTHLGSLPDGAYDGALLPDEAHVVITRFPARALDGLELGALPAIDLAYEVSLALLRTQALSWTIGPPIEG